ncbi:MAG TPA: ferredoxin [Chitinophagaceae bacterium]|nr:ferredoxin [Chitinophagaceae bacterium]MCC6634444.1 ferredoxin [Chitinophagaceae bacterium]HMZ46360.1 ferredoxin [Chitinophagaceae bacterium]HNE93289.1 ferredoxin [Chitinophagaceae bacterium]HNF29690.1 ferredoxin [Chitinophagaceae bacterium]
MPNIIHYRSKCIGCNICYEMMPSTWRMSKKDGKATLLKAEQKRQTSVLQIDTNLIEEAKKVANACPVKIIKVNG